MRSKTTTAAMAMMLMTLLPMTAAAQQRGWRTAADIAEGQRGTISGTVADVSANGELTLTADDDRYSSIRVVTDSVSTQYNGFGGVINGSPEIYTGSSGFANIRPGDRIEVHGLGRANNVVRADTVTLLGRSVDASQVGVGQTRSPNSVSTPTASGATPSTSSSRVSTVEGVVRQVNSDNNLIVVETDRREMITVRGTNSTPVYYRSDVYQMRNLEVGDRVRVQPDSVTSSSGDVRARSIEVTTSVQDSGGTTSRTGQVASVTGRVTRIDRGTNTVRVDTGRGEVNVDVSTANDSSGRRLRASDFQTGDNVDITGNYNGNVFLASTVRFNDEVPGPAGGSPDIHSYNDYVSVTIYGTVTESLRNAPRLTVRDAQNRTYQVMALDDFVIRSKSGSYVAADTLKEGDNVTIKAYRDPDGNYIAQTIRAR